MPTIILQEQLYPEYGKITPRLQKMQEFKDTAYLAFVNEVYFEVAASPATNFYPLIGFATLLQNLNAFKQLVKAAEPQHTDLLYSHSIARTLLLQLFNEDIKDKKTFYKMFDCLLQSKNCYFTLGDIFNLQTPLHILALKGDEHLPLLKKVLDKEPEFSTNAYGLTPLSIAIEEEQYNTVNMILDKMASHESIAQESFCGSSPIVLLLKFCTKLEPGIAVLKRFLSLINKDDISELSLLHHTIANENDECRTAFISILLQAGVNPNARSYIHSHILEDALNHYDYAAAENNTKQQAAVKKIIIQLLEEGADLSLLKNWEKNKIENIVNGTVGIYTTAHGSSSSESKEENEDPFKRKLFAISKLENEDAQDELFRLQKEYEADWHETAANNPEARDRRLSIFFMLFSVFSRGSLSSENILKMIRLCNANLEVAPELKAMLYKSYIVKEIFNFQISRNNINHLENLFAQLLNFHNVLHTEADDNMQEYYFIYLNAMTKKLALIALAVYKNEIIDFGNILKIIDRIPTQAFDAESSLLILQLKLTQAYTKRNIDSFRALLLQFPNEHILRRQYDFWEMRLIELNEPVPITEQWVEDFRGKFNKFRTRYPDVLQETLDCETKNLQRYNEEIKKQKAEAKKQPAKTPKLALVASSSTTPVNSVTIKPNTAPTPVESLKTQANISLSTPSTGNASSSSSSSSSSNSSVILNQRKASQAENHSISIEKTKRLRLATFEQKIIMQTHKDMHPTPNTLHYNEKTIRQYFSSIIQPEDVLKPFRYDNEANICWAICRTKDMLKTETLATQFENKFNEVNEIKFGSTKSGISCEKVPGYKKGVFRIKLGDHDERLSSHTYYLNENKDGVKPRCFLVVFDIPWDHADALKPNDHYLEFQEHEKKLANKF